MAVQVGGTISNHLEKNAVLAKGEETLLLVKLKWNCNYMLLTYP
jgi:hypothetical protein